MGGKGIEAGGEVWATVVSDASFRDRHRPVGWAACVSLDGATGLLRHAAVFRQPIATSVEAEMAAAVNGVALAVRAGATHVLLEADCLAVVEGNNAPVGSNGTAWASALAHGLVGRGLPVPVIVAQHVRGHTKENDAYSRANRWCDEAAKAARHEADAAQFLPGGALAPQDTTPIPGSHRQGTVAAIVFANASHCAETRSAGFALYGRLVSRSDPLIRHGVLPRPVIHSFRHAKMLAAVEAVVCAAEAGATQVSLRIDCKGTANGINRPDSPDHREWRQALGRALSGRGLPRPEIKARYLVGATLQDCQSGKILSWCIERARLEMKARRTELQPLASEPLPLAREAAFGALPDLSPSWA